IGAVTLRYRQTARTRGRLVPRLVPRKSITLEHSNEFICLTATSEPPIGIEPMTYALREARLPAPRARAALMHRPGRSGCPECPESTGIRSTTRSTTVADRRSRQGTGQQDGPPVTGSAGDPHICTVPTAHRAGAAGAAVPMGGGGQGVGHRELPSGVPAITLAASASS